MTRGYIILALHNHTLPDPEAYYKQAVNLAISLRVSDPANGKTGTTLPICLLHDGKGHMEQQFWKLFNHAVLMSEEDRTPFYSKTRLFDYSPFTESCYIDSDSLCIGDPDTVFTAIEKTDFASCVVKRATFATAGNIQMSWVKQIGSIYEFYRIPAEYTFTELNSSMILWRRSDEAQAIFTLAEHFYAGEFFPDFHGLAPRGFIERGHYPDELAFETALLHLNRITPDLDPFWMTFTHGGRGNAQGWTQANKTYPFMTMPGGYGHSSSIMWTAYDRIRAVFARLLGIAEGNPKKYGQGFRMNDRNKAANKPNARRWQGLRSRERPPHISALIEKFSK